MGGIRKIIGIHNDKQSGLEPIRDLILTKAGHRYCRGVNLGLGT
jgi:hypothetical protein